MACYGMKRVIREATVFIMNSFQRRFVILERMRHETHRQSFYGAVNTTSIKTSTTHNSHSL